MSVVSSFFRCNGLWKTTWKTSRFPESITTICCQLVADLLAVSLTKSATSLQLPRLLRSDGETCEMDFGHNETPSESYTGCQLSYGITQCYLPSDTNEHPRLRLNSSQRPVLDLPTPAGWKAELT